MAAAVAVILALGACGGHAGAGGAAPAGPARASSTSGSAATAAGGVPLPKPGPACAALTEQVASGILGQPTRVLDSASAAEGADCQRVGLRDPDDQVEYGWQQAGTPGYESPDQRAAGCQGKISRPAEFGAGAVLCQYRPGPLESDWLGWVVNGTLYMVVIHVDDQQLPLDATLQVAHLLGA